MTAVKKRCKTLRKTSFHRAAARRAGYCHVFVIATMSAGKTTLINTLLGQDLLFSANEAATAALTRLCHNRSQRRRVSAVSYTACGQCYGRRGHIQSETLRQWNAQETVRYIDISCKIDALDKTRGPIVLYDTPGANNSQDAGHRRVWLDALRQPGKSLVVYVLNAGQLAARDDHTLLRELAACSAPVPDRRIIFILNKMDELDEEKGETAAGHLAAARHYLEQAGFYRPVMIPAMMRPALIARQLIAGKNITRSQRNRLRAELYRFRNNKHALNDEALIPAKIRSQIRNELKRHAGCYREKRGDAVGFTKSELRQFIAYSGIRTMEIYLAHYH